MRYLEFNEKKQHGTVDFPVQYYYVDDLHPQYEMPLHWHREFELIRVCQGELRLFLNNQENLLKAGNIAAINCGVLHAGKPRDCVYECIVLDLNILRKRGGDKVSSMIAPLLSGGMSIQLADTVTDRLSDAVSELFEIMRNRNEYDELLVLSTLYKIMHLAYKTGAAVNAETDRRTTRQAEIMTATIDWIDGHFAESITLEQLSRVTGMNQKYLCRFFRAFTDRTPIDYINNLRIEAACSEITENGKTVTEAAFECGFNDLSYFSRTFKKYKNATPREYIRQYKLTHIEK